MLCNLSDHLITAEISPMWSVLSCLWDGAYKTPFAANLKVAHDTVTVGFLSRYLSGPLPYTCHHIPVK